jgi:serine/threonine protein kinase SCH9
MDGTNDDRSRSAAGDEENMDHIGFDTPRSGIATPQPDPHDKRLPSIMSYFGQVRVPSLQRFISGSARPKEADPSCPKPEMDEEQATATSHSTQSKPVGLSSDADTPPLLPHEMVGFSSGKSSVENTHAHPYPTPPTSHRASLQRDLSDAGSDRSQSRIPSSLQLSALHRSSLSDSVSGRSLLRVPSTVAVSAVNCVVSKADTGRTTTSNSPSHSRRSSRDKDGIFLQPAIQSLRKLTDVTGMKSGASTPARTLSTTPPSVSGSLVDNHREIGSNIDRSTTHTPSTTGGQSPVVKGKLTIKITEARGLKRCKDPYVVAVFQRSELISDGPRHTDVDDDAVAMGGVSNQRQASDSGRTPMAIPMKSRQSSNTSVTDHTIFRKRHAGRSLTDPTWDAEAVL